MLDLDSQAVMYRKSTSSKLMKTEIEPAWGKIKIESYDKVFGKLPPMRADNNLSDAFATGASTHSVPLITRKSNELLPGMYSFDPDVIKFQRVLSDTLNKELPIDLDDDGFTRTGIHSSFDNLKCVSGYYMNPLSFTPIDNSLYRRELGLSDGYSERQRMIARNVWKLAWSNAKPAKINVAKLSTGGARRFTYDVQWKLTYAEWLLVPSNFERMLNAVDKEDWLTLANEYETLYMTYIQKRGQVDRPGKDRMVMDLEYALSGGAKSSLKVADKKVVIDGVSYDDFSAMRARVVHAGPWTVNCFLQIAATTCMRSLFDKYPSVFHINTRDEILSVVDGKHVFCSDVTEYDRSMSRDAINTCHEVMAEYWDSRIVKASERLFYSPYYAKPLDKDGKKGVWVRDPRDWKQTVFAGNRSGHALTSLMAKVNKVIETLFIIDGIYPVLNREAEFLKGKMPMGVVNNGDDEIVWADNANDMAKFKTLRADVKNGHYLVEPEAGQGFSGLLLRKIGDKAYDPVARVSTTFEKMWVPERSIGGKHRKYWPIGAITRIDNIMKTDVGRKAWEIHMKCYRDMLAVKFGDLTEIISRALAGLDLDLESLTETDREVIDNPDKLQYKYSSDDVSSNVLDKVTSNIPEHVSFDFLNTYYKGTIV